MGETSPLAAIEASLTAWIERHVGKVVRMELQPRWRLAWAVDAERDGRIVPLYVKGAREVHTMTPLRLEGAALRILNENGIRSPYQYGYCEEADAIVMERLEGQSRLENIADVAVRDRVADQYVEAMVRFHALDPALFAAAGFPMPEDAAALRLAQFDRVEAMYLERKRLPEPCNEFLRLWIRRNVPKGEIRPAFITGDAFQMLYHGGELAAVMDLEMACIGDPLFDLCCIRMRDLSEKTGTAATITRRYAELSGLPIDFHALRFHLVAFAAASSLLISDAMANPAPETDYFEYYVYYHGSLRIALEAMAETMAVTLDPFAAPAEHEGPDAIHLSRLVHEIAQIPANGDMAVYQRSKALAEATFLDRRHRYGAALDRDYRADLQSVLGVVPENEREAEAALEAFVRNAEPDCDERLLRLFHRQAMRQCFLADIPQNGRLKRFLRESIAPLY
jgi:aminoglycoside phosphotransferase (APT) family kinase protein